MCLCYCIVYTGVFSYIAICHMHMLKFCLCSVINLPTNCSHCCCITETCPPFHFELNLTVMVCFMACFTQCDEIVRSITPSFSALNMVHVKNVVFRLSLTMLALMFISCKHSFSHIPKAELFSLLIFHSLNLVVLDFL